MTEQEANEVMEWIADVSSWNPQDVVIKHLYQLHKLRDRAYAYEVSNATLGHRPFLNRWTVDEDNTFWDMQTYEETLF